MLSEQQKVQLSQDLPRSEVKTLPGKRDRDGRPVGYVATHYVIDRLNEVFGHDGWSVAYGDERIREGDRPIVYVPTTLNVHAIGVTKSDIGVGIAANGSPDSFETAIKGACSDGLKRTARMLGASFGLALYDKDQSDVGYSFRCQEIIARFDAAATLDDHGRAVADGRSDWDTLPPDEKVAIRQARDRAEKRLAATAPSQPAAPQAATQPVTNDDALVSQVKTALSLDHLTAILLATGQQTSDRVWTVAVRMAASLDGTSEEQLRSDLGARAKAGNAAEWATVAAFLGAVLKASEIGGVDGAVVHHSPAVKALPERLQKLCTSTAVFHRMALRIQSAGDEATLTKTHANLAAFVQSGKIGKAQAEQLTGLLNARAEALASAAAQNQAA